MLALSTLLATLPALALAQSSTITTSLFGLNSELGYVASVVNSDQSAITYGIACTGGASCIPGYTVRLFPLIHQAVFSLNHWLIE